jgi:hypothetical protein
MISGVLVGFATISSLIVLIDSLFFGSLKISHQGHTLQLDAEALQIAASPSKWLGLQVSVKHSLSCTTDVL